MVNRYNKQNGKAAAEVNRCNKKEKKKEKKMIQDIFCIFSRGNKRSPFCRNKKISTCFYI